MNHIYIYMALHAIVTIGAIITFLLRLEARIVRLETKMEYIEKTTMKAGHILYIYGYQIQLTHSFYADPPEFNIIPILTPPDLQAEIQEEHNIV